MWTRGELKARAKQVLRNNYWKALLVSLVIGMTGGSSRGGAPAFNFGGSSGRGSGNFGGTGSSMDPSAIIAIIAAFMVIILVVLLFAAAIRIFLGYALEVGGRKYFVRAAEFDENMNYLGFAFDNTRYMNIVKAMFMRSLFTFLWFLLLIIPSIVKSYAYSMVPYILADNPNIGYKRALQLSEAMTDGHKFKMWVLDLSFIGWYFLGALACGIGVIFVSPYDFATKAELYLVLRKNALDSGMCAHSELGLEDNTDTNFFSY